MKSPSAAPAYTRTTSLELAAALSILGVDVRFDISEDKVSGKRWQSILLGHDSGADPELPRYNTKLILSMVQNGTLQTEDPLHPVLDGLRACKASEALQLWCKKGISHMQVKVKGSDRWQLQPGEAPISYKTLPGLLGTRDLKMAACLAVLGFQLLRLEDTAPNTLFVFGQALFTPAELPQILRTAYRNKTLNEIDPDHPLLWMMQCLKNKDAIGDMLQQRQPIILIRAPGTGRASIVSANVKGSAMDRVKRHLRIP
jgi:hypothetical protein